MEDGNASAASKDLYSRWLNIPAGPRPPDHYTLLGLPLFHADIEEIEAAAHRQLDLLDIHALHPDPEKRAACQRLMNEVAQARSVLADTQRRMDYDCTLLIRHGVAGAPLPSSGDLRQPASSAPLTQPPEAGSFAPIRARLSKPLSVALLVAALTTVGMLIVWAWVLHGPYHPMETAVVPPTAAPATPNPTPVPAQVLLTPPSVATLPPEPMTPPPEPTPPAIIPATVPAPPAVAVSAAPGKELSLDLGGAMTMRFVYIPPGTFTMGSPDYDKDRFLDEVPAHFVTLTTGFYMAITAVTQEQYQAVMGRNPSSFKGPKNPVEMVSYADATEFCRKVSEKTGRKARLPTEAEWEYACRAGTATAFSFGGDDSALGDYAWYIGNSGDQTHPVGLKKPNAWGLYDMHGNVWEWCADWYGPYDSGSATNPTGPTSPFYRIQRGGAFHCHPRILRSACRSYNRPDNGHTGSGFRVAVESASTVLVQAPPSTRPASQADSLTRPFAVTAAGNTPFIVGRVRAGEKYRINFNTGPNDTWTIRRPSGLHLDGGPSERGMKVVVGRTSPPQPATVQGAWNQWCANVVMQVVVFIQDTTIHILDDGWMILMINDGNPYDPSGSDNAGTVTGTITKILPEAPAPASPPRKEAPATVPAAVVVSPSAAKGKELSLDIGGGVTLVLTLVPAGKFVMGTPAGEANRDADETQHEVAISKLFYMGVYEVTRGQFAAFVKDTGYQTEAEKEGWAYAWDGKTFIKVNGASWRNPGFAQTDAHPVICVSWNDATEFCQWLSRKTGRVVRLPTEAEWEYACRAGTRTASQWGDNPDAGKGWCNAVDQTAKRQFPAWTGFNWEDGFVFTAPVGQFRPNEWGLYDMHGNVWEWCGDRYADYPGGAVTDPTGPDSGQYRVLRGGSWGSAPKHCRSGVRRGITPDTRRNVLGFRVVVESAPTAVVPVSSAGPNALTNSIGMKFILIRPGEFHMGSSDAEVAQYLREAKEKAAAKETVDPLSWYQERIPTEGPRHRVRITNAFYMGVYHVTQMEYQMVMVNNPSQFCATGPSWAKSRVAGRDTARLPVENVTWRDAQKFCQMLSGLPNERKAGHEYRLPTEAEWEYACRAGTSTAYSFGDDGASLDDYAWTNRNSGRMPHPVGEKKPNPWGLYDMHGNVAEWCMDWYGKGYYTNSPLENPQGPDSGSAHVLRGGSWYMSPNGARSALRNFWNETAGDCGFRVVFAVAGRSPSKATGKR